MGLDSIDETVESLRNILKTSDYSDMKSVLNESMEAIDISVELLNETLQVDKIESGLFTCEKTNINLGPFIKKSVSIFHGKCVSKNVVLDYNIWENDRILRTIVNIDETKMAQVLRNFLSNALKFTPTGGKIIVNVRMFYKDDLNKSNKVAPLDIESGLELQSANFVRVEVIDTGIGISHENIDKLFNQVIQIDARSSQGGGGNGFGLLISRKIVEMHDGNIGVTSDGFNQGSCFYVEIPILEISTEAPVSTPIVSNRRELRNSGGGETREAELTQITEEPMNSIQSRPMALIVEDTISCAKIMAKFLNKNNVDAVCVYNGKEAVDKIKEDVSKYALILMDNQMPIMNGMEATEKIRKLGYENPIIGVTGNVMDDDVEKFKKKGVNEVLGKPVKNDDLRELLARYKIIL
tara:strand:- start:54 stop:1280 length:1227 start_codon:yes stop_codon:yes gene_type:complete